jgi:hypothetical protein
VVVSLFNLFHHLTNLFWVCPFLRSLQKENKTKKQEQMAEEDHMQNGIDIEELKGGK